MSVSVIIIAKLLKDASIFEGEFKMITNEQLADLIFPDVKETIEDLEKRYPKRNLGEKAEVTRFAPSPTGFLHTGSLFTSMICQKLAKQSGGVFYIRLEDTDTKREISGAGEQLLNEMKKFDVVPNEGYLGDHEEGEYGPYTQSKRAHIYKVCIKELLRQGKAYPCFCSSSDIEELRKAQEANKMIPGYYGPFAKCKMLTNEERYELIKSGKPFVIRFNSNGNHNRKIRVFDLIHGTFAIAENDQDIVIYKSDGLPTYHFAHACDDHFMHTTTVIRGEEWISSLPIHLQLFEALGFETPSYAHVPVIMKIDENGNRRKLSKRKDKEAAVSYFLDDGYPSEALIMYLMTIANSNFEEYIFQEDFKNMDKFELSFEKFSLDGALFDEIKLQFFAREILARKTKEEMLQLTLAYAKDHDERLYSYVNSNKEYFMEIINIERENENPRKDYYKLGGLLDTIGFFYNDIYDSSLDVSIFNPNIASDIKISLLEELRDTLDFDKPQDQWFNDMKEIGQKHKFAPSNKIYKADKENYVGHVGDVAELLRISLCAKKNAPNLYYVMRVLGKAEVTRRIDKVISLL